jgi:hypothetical protein
MVPNLGAKVAVLPVLPTQVRWVVGSRQALVQMLPLV